MASQNNDHNVLLTIIFSAIILIQFIVKINCLFTCNLQVPFKALEYKGSLNSKFLQNFIVTTNDGSFKLEIKGDEAIKIQVNINTSIKIKSENQFNEYLNSRSKDTPIITAFRDSNTIYSANLAPKKNYKFNYKDQVDTQFKVIEMITGSEDLIEVTKFLNHKKFNKQLYHLIVLSPIDEPYLLTYHFVIIGGIEKVFIYNSKTNQDDFFCTFNEFISGKYLNMPEYLIKDETNKHFIPITGGQNDDEIDFSPQQGRIKGICPYSNSSHFTLGDSTSFSPFAMIYDSTKYYTEAITFLVKYGDKIYSFTTKFKVKEVEDTTKITSSCEFKSSTFNETELTESMSIRKQNEKTYTMTSLDDKSYYVVEATSYPKDRIPTVKLAKVRLFYGKEVTHPDIRKRRSIYRVVLRYEDKKEIYTYHFKHRSTDPRVELEKPDNPSKMILIANWNEYKKLSHLLPYYMIPIGDNNTIVFYQNATYSVNSIEGALRLKDPFFVPEPIGYELHGLDCKAKSLENRIMLPGSDENTFIQFNRNNCLIDKSNYLIIFCTILIISLHKFIIIII